MDRGRPQQGGTAQAGRLGPPEPGACCGTVARPPRGAQPARLAGHVPGTDVIQHLLAIGAHHPAPLQFWHRCLQAQGAGGGCRVSEHGWLWWRFVCVVRWLWVVCVWCGVVGGVGGWGATTA